MQINAMYSKTLLLKLLLHLCTNVVLIDPPSPQPDNHIKYEETTGG